MKKFYLIIFLLGVFGIAFPLQFSDAFEYSPLPIISLKDLPTQTDFLSKDKESLLGDTIHSTFIRENGETIELYLLASNKKAVGIFYFEDKTDKIFTDNAYYQTDLFVMNFRSDIDAKITYVIASQRNDNSCVKSIVSGEDFDYSLEGDCSAGAVIIKQTKEGWAAYVKFFVDFEKPLQDKPYYLKWAYVDAAELDDKERDTSAIYLWPESFFWDGTAYLSQEEHSTINVNSGRLEINDFLYMPNDILTKNLSQNKIQCADNTVKAMTDEKDGVYTKEDVARISAKINSIQKDVKIFLTVYDQQDNVILKKSTQFLDSDPFFLIDFKDFNPGLYNAVIEFGINGPKGQVLFGVDYQKPIIQEEPNQCTLYLLYDNSKNSLIIFGQIYDPSGTSFDGFHVFLDRNGDGFSELNKDDLQFYITKNDFGGKKITGSEGWQFVETHQEKGNARINQLRDGYDVYLEISDVSKGFKIATEQSDYTFSEYKKSRFPPNSFSTAPQTWATANFVDKNPKKYEASQWVPNEITVTQSIDLNLILVGDEWSEQQKKQILNKLYKSNSPLISSELHLSGAKYLYQYKFVSAPKEFSTDLFNMMKEDAKRINPFYGENDYKNPSGIANWVKTNHTEWVDVAQQRYDIAYKLIDAQKVESFIYDNLIAKDSSLNHQNSANLVFIADDMKEIDFLHNYIIHTKDPSTDKYHKAVGLMGYGGKHNTYFFDLYAVPWDKYQGVPGWYDPNLINEYTDFHDLINEEDRIHLFADYINNATSLLITPSYVYPPVYKTNYLIDLVIATEPSSTANTVLIDHFIDEGKIISQLEELIPNSSWTLNLTLENMDSSNLPTNLKKILNSAKKVYVLSEDSGPVASILDTEDVSRELISWASTRESSDFRDFEDIKNSQWTIPVLVIIGKSDNQWYIGDYGVIGYGAPNPEDENQPCCAIALSNDKTVWTDNSGMTDLVVHEVGHVLGLSHPFQGYSPEFDPIRNDYFNWYGSVMAYSSPLHGCSYWYSLFDEDPCGISDSYFTHFEKETISRGIATYLIKSAENNVYRTLLELEQEGTSPNNLPQDIQYKIDNIESKIKRAKDAFQSNIILGADGAIQKGYAAASDSQSLVSNYEIEYKHTETEITKINIPNWIKDQADWWVAGSISDTEFLNSIQYLMKEKIIVIPPTDSSGQEGSKNIPDWVKTNVGWWSTGTISDKELVSSLQFLIKNGIIRVN